MQAQTSTAAPRLRMRARHEDSFFATDFTDFTEIDPRK
jgi:hypothetical protein